MVTMAADVYERNLTFCFFIMPLHQKIVNTKKSPQCVILSNPTKNRGDLLTPPSLMVHMVKINKAHKIVSF
jgi:hypothetical protein